MAMLGLAYELRGWWDAAEELEVQVMETRKKTLTSMNNLAFTWKGISKETEATRLIEECIQSRQRVLGLDHPDTLSSCRALVAWMAEQEDVVF
jgi:Tetratricopeptide repeat